MKKIKVLIVDDSAIVRNAFSSVLSRDAGIDVVGGATDPYEARDKIVKLKPDVITLDINMSRMDGLTFLKKLMKHFPLPVIMVSGVSDENAKITLKSLEYGAVEFIAKPLGGANELKDLSVQLIQKIKAAASAKIGKKYLADKQALSVLPDSRVRSNHKIIALGASTGGTEALRAVLRRLPPNSPPILVVQHMPENFT
jgi:two-component system chemotaxis response regulator CheB